FQCHGARARNAVLALQSMSGVDLVRLNPRAGSLTVHYDPSRHSHDDLLQLLAASGCLESSALRLEPTIGKPAGGSEGVVGVFGKAVLGVLAQRTATRLVTALL
ncbi:MAG: hypothetical protein ACFCUJ_13200, partial [Thiotrichales bacterium]